MKLIINRKDYTLYGHYIGRTILRFMTKYFKFNWFTEFHSWFIYVHFGKHWVKFSDAGFLISKNFKK